MASKHKELPDLSSPSVSPDESIAPTPERARLLAARHGFPSEFELFELLDESWFWWRVGVESGPPPTGGARREFLRELSQRAELLAEAIPKMHLSDKAAMHDAAPRLELAALSKTLHELSSASRTALSKLPKSKAGARGSPDTIALLCRLWRIYREAFGPNAARLTRVGTVYGGKFFEFANDTLRLFGVRMSNGALGKAIQKAQRAVEARDAHARMP